MAIDKLGQQDVISDAKAILTLISDDLRSNTGIGTSHEPVTLSGCVTNMFDIDTAQVLTIDLLAASGDLFTVDSASSLARIPIGASFAFLQSDSQSVSWTACPNVADGASGYYGNHQDVAMGYDEAGDDQFVVTGASWLFDGPQVNIGAVGGGGELLAVRVDQNANTAVEIVNANTGTAAGAALRVKNVAGAGGDDALTMIVTSTGYTPANLFLADQGIVKSGVNAAGGLLLLAEHATGPVTCGVNATVEVWKADTTGFTVNDPGADLDFIVKGVGQASALVVQGSDGHVSVGVAPSASYQFYASSAGNTAAIYGLETSGIGVYAVSATGTGLEVNLTGAGTIAAFKDGGVSVLGIQDGGNILLIGNATLDLDGLADVLIFDADGDTTMSAPTDDQIDIEIAGSDDFTFTANSFNVLAGSYINGHGVRATLANAVGLYVPWITDDADSTSYFGSLNAANDRVAVEAKSYSTSAVSGQSVTGAGISGNSTSGRGVSAICATGTGIYVNLSGAGTAIADFQDDGTSVLTIQDGGETDFTEYIRHLSDAGADTWMQFQEDRWTLTCGAITMIDAVEAATDYLWFHAGFVGINETANANMSIGLTIDQAANDDEIFNARSSDVGAVLSTVETGTYLVVKKSDGGAGGAQLLGFRDADSTPREAFSIRGYLAEDANVVKTTSATAIVEIQAYQTGGAASPSVENTVANGNLLALRTYRGGAVVTTHWFDEDGDFGYNGSLVSYDDLQDAAMARDVQLVLTGRKGIHYNQDAMVEAGIIHPSPDGQFMVSHKRMTALQLGALAQAYEDRRRLEARIECLERKLEKCQ